MIYVLFSKKDLWAEKSLFMNLHCVQYSPANGKVPNKNFMLTFWRTLKKLSQEKRLSGEIYIKSYIIAYAQVFLEMPPQ